MSVATGKRTISCTEPGCLWTSQPVSLPDLALKYHIKQYHRAARDQPAFVPDSLSTAKCMEPGCGWVSQPVRNAGRTLIRHERKAHGAPPNPSGRPVGRPWTEARQEEQADNLSRATCEECGWTSIPLKHPRLALTHHQRRKHGALPKPNGRPSNHDLSKPDKLSDTATMGLTNALKSVTRRIRIIEGRMAEMAKLQEEMDRLRRSQGRLEAELKELGGLDQ